MSDAIWIGLALVLVFEGLLPAIHPGGWRSLFEQMTKLNDQQIRTAGLVSMVVGLVLLWVLQAGS